MRSVDQAAEFFDVVLAVHNDNTTTPEFRMCSEPDADTYTSYSQEDTDLAFVSPSNMLVFIYIPVGPTFTHIYVTVISHVQMPVHFNDFYVTIPSNTHLRVLNPWPGLILSPDNCSIGSPSILPTTDKPHTDEEELLQEPSIRLVAAVDGTTTAMPEKYKPRVFFFDGTLTHYNVREQYVFKSNALLWDSPRSIHIPPR